MRKSTTKKAAPPTSRFVIIKQDCKNVEGTEDTLDEALALIQDKVAYGDWDGSDIEYVRILEVTHVHTITLKEVKAEPTDLSDI